MEIHLEINSLCTKCNNCLAVCPANSIIKNDNNYYIETWSCYLCELCIHVCPEEAIKEKLSSKP